MSSIFIPEILKMKIIFNFLFFISAVAVGISACNKADEGFQNTTNKIVIDSLVATFDTVMAWDTTTITCYARGESLEYHWECDHGNFNGGGTQIKYAAGQCCVGGNTITYRVSNETGSVFKSIKIVVTNYVIDPK